MAIGEVQSLAGERSCYQRLTAGHRFQDLNVRPCRDREGSHKDARLPIERPEIFDKAVDSNPAIQMPETAATHKPTPVFLWFGAGNDTEARVSMGLPDPGHDLVAKPLERND